MLIRKMTVIFLYCLAILLHPLLVDHVRSQESPAKKSDQALMKENVFTGWKDKWPDGKSTGVKVKISEKDVKVTGTSNKTSYANAYQKLNVDLNDSRYLVVNVESVEGFWYIIVKNPGIKGGYVKVQPNTQSIGRHIYDLKSIVHLDGKRDLEIDLGVSSGRSDPVKGKSVVFDKIQFVSGKNGVIPGAVRLGPWKEKWPDGTSTGATVKDEDGEIIITGRSEQRSYGTVYRVVSTNLDATPILKLQANEADGFWFLQMSGGAVKGTVTVQNNTNSVETMSYNLNDALGLYGPQTFEMHLGVSSGKADPNAGKKVIFKGEFEFAAQAQTAQ